MAAAKGKPCWSWAEKTGGLALLAAGLLAMADPQLAILPLALFLLACLIAPFLPRSSFFLPVISRGGPQAKQIAITIDDGPSPASTPLLLELLAQYGLPATFFVVGERAAAHPELIDQILAAGHSIGNHSLHHDPLLMLRGSRRLHADIEATQQILSRAGIRPLLFRPPIGITSPRLQPILASLGLTTVTFSCRIFDRGNRDIDNLANRVLNRLQPGDILLLHDLPPRNNQDLATWTKELHTLFAIVSAKDFVTPLTDLIAGRDP